MLVAVENHRTTAQLLARGFPAAQTHHLGDIAVLSRWPISSPRSVWTVPGWSDVMRVEVVRPGAPFVVYAMHLGNPLFKTTYTQHAEMVERLVAAAQAESLPVVLAGDFNMSDRSAVPGTRWRLPRRDSHIVRRHDLR